MTLDGCRAFNGHTEFEVEDLEEEGTKATPDPAKTARWRQSGTEGLDNER